MFFGVAIIAAHFTDRSKEGVIGPFKVLDGDSLSANGEKLRLEGIDAPEWSQMCTRLTDGVSREWPCGQRSRAYLKNLLSNKRVTCNSYGRDKYDRPLVKCKIGEIDLNASVVSAGWAVSYGDYYAEEAHAKRNRLGIWQGSFDRPQDWRRARRGEVADGGFGVGKLIQLKRWLFSFF